ncbi:MAG TPA: ParB/RepB/Spo0J family partition protein [Candidatus Coprosoma intestinipullorum]|uniref:ParB/RepB/Spo0J family partition protein n=1 Tax=Candidatus Coprosoma intestinipullorum TaxID=2840752 RepID=A0A9D1CY53_9FIRM|nr:ParB/RepB/Spo0J family partition protein [Candidatus Coprosoma intestinipullorum]
MESRRALGKGLEQLFDLENLNVNNVSDFEKKMYEDVKTEEIVEIPINELRPNPYQPRTVFDEDALNELAESIKENGVFQPIIVKKSIKGYDVIAGERRLRASKIAGLKTIPAIIRQLSDEKMAEIALLENLQRENLNSLEEAKAYKSLIDKLHLTQEELAKKVSKSRSHITNMLGLLRLPNEVQDMVMDNKITMGHARALSKIDDEEEVIKMANEVVDSKLTVRDIETKTEEAPKKVKVTRHPKHTEYDYVQDLMREKLDTKVKIKDKKIEISFNNEADLNRILEILNIKE